MAKKYYLGLDNGTTGTTALLLDENQNVAGRGYKEITTSYPHNGWVEQGAIEIWSTIAQVTADACAEAGITPDEITCIGLDNVGETVVLWDKKTGVPIYNAIVWQDRRTAEYCDSIKEKYDQYVMDRTGVMIDSYFSATKIKWVIDNVEGARNLMEEGRLLASTLDGWIFWKITGGRLFITDPSTASRTMLFNIHLGKWDRDLLDMFGIKPDMLPEIRSSSDLYGYTDPSAFLGAKIPLAGAAVDQQAALFGQACFHPGMIKCTYGTGCFMLMNTGDKPVSSPHGLLTTVAWGLKGKLTYALDGGIYVTGAATKWLRDKLGIIRNAAATERMAFDAGSNGGIYFVPAFSGLAAPHWDSYARGTIIGITGGTTREHIVRATLESTAYQVKDNLDVMQEDSGIEIKRLRADGGAVANKFLMQFQADLLGIPIDIPKITETTALGAAYLAAMGIGDFTSLEDISEHWELAETFEPRMNPDTRADLLHMWHRAVERSMHWIESSG